MKNTFEQLGLSSALVGVTRELGYKEPTPIQVQAVPLILAGGDMVGQSKTGSGKTAAFGLPLLERIDISKRQVQVLVLCPTRELSGQVARELRRLGRSHSGLAIVELIGGLPGGPQRDALARGVHIAVGTPGRILDHLKKDVMDVTSLNTVVLDEADRMLDMGFEVEVTGILKALPPSRQTVLFSATFPETIEAISQRYQRDAKRVVIEAPADEADDIHQVQIVAKGDAKLHALCFVLQKYTHDTVLIFCNFKATVSSLVAELKKAGLNVDRLDGDLDQFEREQVLARFRNHSLRVLVATDVAGRGLDVKGLDLVVNYEMPQQAEIYVHRIGRTGRAGRRGVAVSLTSGLSDSRVKQAELETGKKIAILERKGQTRVEVLLKGLVREPKMLTLKIAGGRRDKLRPGDIVGALTGKGSRLTGKDLGKIEVHDRLTYVAVSRRHAEAALELLQSGLIKKKRFRARLLG